MTRPVWYRPSTTSIGWLDPVSGAGVLESGRHIFARPTDRRRRGPDLADLLDTLAAAGVTRAYLAGPNFSPAWFTYASGRPGGWRPGAGGHYQDLADPRLTLERDTPNGVERVELRRATAWGLPAETTPTAARDAWAALSHHLLTIWKPPSGVGLVLTTPTGTGQQLAALAAPAGWDGAQVDSDVAELIRRTSPQHRIEVTGACWSSCDAHARRPAGESADVHYLDARFAYGSLLRELGTAPATRLNRSETFDRLERDPFGRWRGRVTFTVPRGWEHPGMLMAPHPNGRNWHAPNRPGFRGETWADAVELVAASRAGWVLEPLEGLAFNRPAAGAGPLDNWGRRLLELWARLGKSSEPGDRLAATMVRAIVLKTVGSFHSTGRRVRHVGWPIDVPDQGVSQRTDLDDGRVTWTTREPAKGAAAAWLRPELSSQIWGRAHARLAIAPGAGFLKLAPGAVVGLWGDALFVAGECPTWPDDGKAGRYRIKGASDGPIALPSDIRGLIQLRSQIGAENG